MIDHEQIENGSFEGKIDWIIVVKKKLTLQLSW